jgi:hypothetical protein
MTMNKALNDFTGTVRRAVDDYDMIREGDRVAVGVSGGKDSLLLLLALRHLQSFYPRHFDLEAITIELGFEGMDFAPVAAEEPEAFTPRIVRTKKFDIRPMSEEEAMLQMEMLGHSFFVFENAETGEVNVLYVRKDGNYGLIERA